MSCKRLVPASSALLLGVLLVELLAFRAGAVVIHVAANGSGDYPTIQTAVDAAAAGDIVRLGPGTYSDLVSRTLDGRSTRAICFMKSGVTLESSAGAAATVLECSADRRGIVGEDLAPTTVVRGVTVQNGRPRSGDGNTIWGGGMLFYDSGLTVEECIVTNCATAGGGGIFFYSSYGSNGPTVRNNLFHHNPASQLGGGVEIYLGTGFRVDNNTFAFNSAPTGAGLVVNGTTGTVNRNIFYGNTAGGGSGIGCLGTATTHVDGTCNLFFANLGSNTGSCTLVVVGAGGNAAVDPLFCDATNGDYRLQSNSPGAPGQSSCGLIGAFPASCTGSPPSAGLRIPEVPGAAGSEVVVPVILDGAGPLGGRSYQTELSVDPGVLSFSRVDAAGTLSEGMLVVGHSPAAGHVRIAAAGVDPIGADATLVNVVFDIAAGTPDGTQSPVSFESFAWGEDSTVPALTGGTVTVGEPLSAGGTVTYYNTENSVRPVEGVEIELTGSRSGTTTSAANGSYSFGNLWSGMDVHVAPSYDGADLTAISSFDASLVLGYLVELETLDARQLVAADVTGNGNVSAEDASRILEVIVAPETVPDPLWLFDPEQRDAVDITESVTGLDFAAILRGDVSGSWCPSYPCDAPSRRSAPAWTAGGSWTDGVFVLAVAIDEAGSRGLDFALEYDSANLEFQGLETRGAGLWTSRAADGRVAVAGATAAPWPAGEPVVTARFTARRSPPRGTQIRVAALRIDESAPQERPVPVPGVRLAGVLEDFDVHVAPNPARDAVRLGVVGATAPVRVDVYNVAGRKIRSLGATPTASGERTLTWDRRDDGGVRVSDGIYFVRIGMADRIVTKRVVLVR